MKIHKILKYSILFLLGALLLIVIYVYLVIHALKLKMNTLKIIPNQTPTSLSVLEEGSFVEVDKLRSFWSFTKYQITFDDWVISQKIGQKCLIKIEQNTELAHIIINDC